MTVRRTVKGVESNTHLLRPCVLEIFLISIKPPPSSTHGLEAPETTSTVKSKVSVELIHALGTENNGK